MPGQKSSVKDKREKEGGVWEKQSKNQPDLLKEMMESVTVRTATGVLGTRSSRTPGL